MRCNLCWIGVVTVAFLMSTGPLLAHHSFAAEFDQNKPISFTGTVQKIEWMNPHIYTYVEVKEAGGKLVVYSVEGGPPNSLFRQGWRKDDLKPGDIVTVNGVRAKNPESNRVGSATIATADGKRIFGGSPGPAAQ